MWQFLQLTFIVYFVASENLNSVIDWIDSRVNEEKYALLAEHVAKEWGYEAERNTNITDVNAYLQQLAYTMLSKYNLSNDQKLRSILARHVLKNFEKAITQVEYVNQLHKLDLRASSATELDEEHLFLEKILDSMVLNEEEIVMDLLVRSMAPEGLTPLRHHSHDQYMNDLVDLALIKPKRNVGTVVTLNRLLDMGYRDTTNVKNILQLSSRQLQSHFEQRVLANFDVLIDNKTMTTISPL